MILAKTCAIAGDYVFRNSRACLSLPKRPISARANASWPGHYWIFRPSDSSKHSARCSTSEGWLTRGRQMSRAVVISNSALGFTWTQGCPVTPSCDFKQGVLHVSMHAPPPALRLPHYAVSDLRSTLLTTVCSIFPVLKTDHLYVIDPDRGKPGMYSKRRGSTKSKRVFEDGCLNLKVDVSMGFFLTVSSGMLSSGWIVMLSLSFYLLLRFLLAPTKPVQSNLIHMQAMSAELSTSSTLSKLWKHTYAQKEKRRM